MFKKNIKTFYYNPLCAIVANQDLSTKQLIEILRIGNENILEKDMVKWINVLKDKSIDFNGIPKEF